MIRIIVATIALLVGSSAICGEIDPSCNVAAHLVRPDFRLPRVTAAIANKNLSIIVVGSASSILTDQSGAQHAYPARLESMLASKLKNVAVKVHVFARPRETAAQMEKALAPILGNEKPALTIWQTGTVEAMRRVDLDEFRISLDDGIDRIEGASSDVVLMNQQYSPRTELMIDAPQYAEAMRFVALQHEIPLFDRFAVMRHWGELGTFDLNEATKKIDTAARVHNCIGQLLAGLILEAAHLPDGAAQDNH
ncbi:MAG: SGNH/GDSL hydrolase family protein [Xanthobacteraceae bacterium]